MASQKSEKVTRHKKKWPGIPKSENPTPKTVRISTPVRKSGGWFLTQLIYIIYTYTHIQGSTFWRGGCVKTGVKNVKKWSKSVKKVKKVSKSRVFHPGGQKCQKVVKKCEKSVKNDPPQKWEKVTRKVKKCQNWQKKGSKKVKTRPLKVSRIYVFLKTCFGTPFFDPRKVKKSVKKWQKMTPPKSEKKWPEKWKTVKSVKKVKKWPENWKKCQKSEKSVKNRQICQIPGSDFSDSGGQKVKILGSGFQNRGSKSVRFRVEKWRKKRGFWEVFERFLSESEKVEKKEENLTNFWVTTGRSHPTCWSFFFQASWMPGFRHAHTLQQLQLINMFL